jgi:hypothetical protein
MRGYEDTSRTTNYVFDGTDVVEIQGSAVVMVSSESDLTALAGKVGPGSIAYTSGWQAAWQLGIDDSTWTQFIGGGD